MQRNKNSVLKCDVSLLLFNRLRQDTFFVEHICGVFNLFFDHCNFGRFIILGLDGQRFFHLIVPTRNVIHSSLFLQCGAIDLLSLAVVCGWMEDEEQLQSYRRRRHSSIIVRKKQMHYDYYNYTASILHCQKKRNIEEEEDDVIIDPNRHYYLHNQVHTP